MVRHIWPLRQESNVVPAQQILHDHREQEEVYDLRDGERTMMPEEEHCRTADPGGARRHAARALRSPRRRG